MTDGQNSEVTYQNNPFTLALDGLNLLFKLAQSVAIFGIVLSVLGFAGGYANPSGDSSSSTTSSEDFVDTISSITPEVWAVIAVIALTLLLAFFVIGMIISGILDYTAAKLARNQTATLKEAFKATMAHFGGYLWVRIIVAVKTFLWSLLLLVPGVIMSYRYSLAGVAFFADNKKGGDAVRHSLALTRGAWLTTFASQTLFNLITLGFISSLLTPGTNGLLYRQYAALGDQPKPKAHVLSWLTLIIPIVLWTLLLFGLVLLTYAVGNYYQAPPAPSGSLT